MKRKIFVIGLIISVILATAIAASAAHGDESASVELYENQGSASSDIMTASRVSVTATNHSSSSHMVWAVAQYKDGNNYDNKEARYIHVGDTVTFNSPTFDTSDWYLELNPTGLGENCRASGTISKIA